ncbi:ABC transporter ATP-binding protein [Demequina globuliformis]|uniref:ABC transporter ATP-binding protein n=1 Tax=Demequina globuliformis TaxID=676202 RepID=UPI000782B4E9|nr:ATP-binding cassette domain-containing protein [Demequina globuliformis]
MSREPVLERAVRADAPLAPASPAGPGAALGSAPHPRRAAITVQGLSVSFAATGRGAEPVRVLDNVTLEVADREFVAILGPSGCGKSTLLRAMGSLLDARASTHGAATAGGSTAWMPQRDCLLPWRRAMANAMVGAIAAGVPRERAAARAARLFEDFGLAGFESAWPHQLSGGMRQRLALLRTCLSERPVLLLDEPFGALDPVTRRRMNQWLASLELADWIGEDGEEPRAVVLVTHDVDEAIALADRIVVLSGRPGRIVLEVAAQHAGAARGQRFDREQLLAALDYEG